MPLADALRDSELNFQTLADEMSQFAWMAAPDGAIFWYNKRWYEYTGEKLDTMRGWGWRKIHHPDHVGRVVDSFKQCILTGQKWEDTFPLRDKDGGYRWFLSRAIPIRDEQGRVLRWFGTNTDVTDLRDTQEALLESQARLQAVLDHLPVGVWFADEQGRIVYGNPAGQRIWAGARYIGPEEFREYRAWWEGTGEPLAPEDWGVVRAVRNGEMSLNELLRIACFDGSQRVILNSAVPVRGPGGGLHGAVVLNLDVTEQRAAEKAAREHQERLRVASDVAEIGLWHWDLIADEVFWSDRFRALMGFRDGEHCDASTISVRVPEGDRATFLHFAKAIECTVGEHELEFRVQWPDGSEHWILARGKTRAGEGGTPALSIGAAIDITKRRELEERLRRFNEMLEQRVLERTVEARQRTAQLQQLALELSQAEERERQRIATNLHDDLQQHLVALKLGIGRIAACSGDADLLQERLREYGQLIEESIEKSRHLTHDLSPPTLRQNGLLAALDWLAGDMAKRQGLQVTLQTDPDAEPASPALAAMLFRSVRELLFNVVKHAGVKKAAVNVGRLDGFVQVQVRDEGKGLDSSKLEAATHGVGSFGLFSICERVDFLGGRICVDSAPGKGCTVTLLVPKDTAEQAASPLVEALSFGAFTPLERGAGEEPKQARPEGMLRVLLVDDHDVMREGLANLLEDEEDVEVVGQASNGWKGVQLAAELRPDVILMDVTMPVMDGIQATAEIHQRMPGLRVIGLSMHDDPDTERRMIEAGAESYLSKAGSLDRLIDAIRGVTA